MMPNMPAFERAAVFAREHPEFSYGLHLCLTDERPVSDPAAIPTLVAPDGQARHLSRADLQIAVGDRWRSPHSGALYPARWVVTVPGAGLSLQVEPYLPDQELNVSYQYWEGAVRVRGDRGGQPIAGSGYVELTGYASSMRGRL